MDSVVRKCRRLDAPSPLGPLSRPRERGRSSGTLMAQDSTSFVGEGTLLRASWWRELPSPAGGRGAGGEGVMPAPGLHFDAHGDLAPKREPYTVQDNPTSRNCPFMNLRGGGEPPREAVSRKVGTSHTDTAPITHHPPSAPPSPREGAGGRRGEGGAPGRTLLPYSMP